MVGTFSDAAEVGSAAPLSLTKAHRCTAPDITLLRTSPPCTRARSVAARLFGSFPTSGIRLRRPHACRCVGQCPLVESCSNAYSQSNFAMVDFAASTFPNDRIVTATTNPVPEPASAVLVAVGLLTLGFIRIWMRRRDAIPHRC